MLVNKIARGHTIEAKSELALQFFSTHHDYRRGKIREHYVPEVPTGDQLYENASLTPGHAFQKTMYEDVKGIICTDSNNQPVFVEQIGCFQDANLSKQILINLTKMKIVAPLPIQCFLIPFLLLHKGKNTIAVAPTGSGKTAAVMIPMVEFCIRAKQSERPGERPPHAPLVIVIGATRDLVHQFFLDTLRLAENTGVFVKTAFGEYAREDNKRDIREGCDILIATAGRFVDFVDSQDVLVHHARYLAVDEADKLIVDELIQDLMVVIQNKKIRSDMVYTLFSATFNSAVSTILPKLLNDDYIKVELITDSISPTVKQRFENIPLFERKEYILNFLKSKAKVIPPSQLPFDVTNFVHRTQYHVPKTIIYADARRTIDYLSIYLSTSGIRSYSMHGGRSQAQRNKAWKGFIRGDFQVLCASNIAARGINFPGVEQIINYDAPTDWDTYVHRIGRAGRLGYNAEALTFLNEIDSQHMILANHIVPCLQQCGQEIPPWLKRMSNIMKFGTQDDLYADY